MTKLILWSSLFLNIVLSYFVFNKKTEIVERVIIETHAQKKLHPTVPVKPQDQSISQVRSKKKQIQDEMNPESLFYDQSDLQDAGEKMEAERLDFFQIKLGMSDEKISEHNRLRDAYLKKMSEFWKKNPTREPTFQERRKMIELEEELFTKLERLHGKKNWERYKKFREKYNEKGLKKQIENNVPFIFMGL
jgi:hypothetical protein